MLSYLESTTALSSAGFKEFAESYLKGYEGTTYPLTKGAA